MFLLLLSDLDVLRQKHKLTYEYIYDIFFKNSLVENYSKKIR